MVAQVPALAPRPPLRRRCGAADAPGGAPWVSCDAPGVCGAVDGLQAPVFHSDGPWLLVRRAVLVAAVPCSLGLLRPRSSAWTTPRSRV